MIIIEKNEKNKIHFDALSTGDIFKDYNGDYFMRIFSEVDESDNAVSLQTGVCEYFKDYDAVEIVNDAKVIIGN